MLFPTVELRYPINEYGINEREKLSILKIVMLFSCYEIRNSGRARRTKDFFSPLREKKWTKGMLQSAIVFFTAIIPIIFNQHSQMTWAS